MRSKLALLMLFVGGITASIAVASPSTLKSIAASKAKKVAWCHYTGSRRAPFRLVRVSGKPLKVHRAHRRDIPATNGRCPGFRTRTVIRNRTVTVTVATTVTVPPTTTTTASTTTGSTTSTTSSTTTTTTPTSTTTGTTGSTTSSTTSSTTTAP